MSRSEAAASGPGPFDVLVIGSGVAGLSAAVRLADAPGALNVGVLTKGELSQSATRWAQGGVAAVLGGDEDSTDLHLADTLAAGAGLCDVDADDLSVPGLLDGHRPLRLIIAADVGPVRLIDNAPVEVALRGTRRELASGLVGAASGR